MRAILINSSHLVDGYKNRFRYRFPTNWSAPRGSSIALQAISIYNSTFNIKPVYDNDIFQVSFGPAHTYTWRIPSGYYSISDLNNFLQAQSIINKLYAVKSDGSNVYFIQLMENPTRYSAQLNLYPLALSDGYALPEGSNLTLTALGVATTPQVTISVGLGSLLGLPVQKLPLTPQTTAQQFVSQDFGLSPTLSPVDTYVLLCNLIKNDFGNPNNLLHQIPLSSPLGQLIFVNISSMSFQQIYPMTYEAIEISLCDQNFNPLENQDTAMTLTLVIQMPE